ncbi:MAG: aldehyde dehydrogenase [Klenkia sp.]|nr:aldehyde dehydrogenase [Klenkia sp.]
MTAPADTTTPTLEHLLTSLRAGDVADATALYVDGRWVPSAGAGTIDVLDPATEQVVAADQARAVRVARKLEAGQVQVNGSAFNPAAPFGGYEQSGRGSEAGAAGFEEFLETKAIQL